MKIFESKAYKTIMGYVNGWGASVVIVGALFKIMHFPGASIMLVAGMLVEAFIFFLSAFEPPMKHFDWSLVFPELGKHDLQHGAAEVSAKQPVAAVSGGKASAPAVAAPAVAGNVDLGLEAGDLDRLKAGISKLAETADNFASMVGKTPDVTEKMTKISESFDELGARTQEMSKALQSSVEGLSSGYNDINRLLVDSAQSLTDQIKSNCEKLAGSIGESASGCTVPPSIEEQHG